MSNIHISRVWAEKYRPECLEDIVLLDSDKTILLNVLKDTKSIPNFLLTSGAPGTGKTTVALVIVKELGCDKLVLNASDDRGIDVIREQVKVFAQTLSFDVNLKRCVILNEADGLTPTALNSLRDIMECYSNNVFFVLTANKSDKIIEPIKSRCLCLNFSNPPKEPIVERLKYIAEQEHLDITEPDIENLVNLYYPDMRKMIITLQKVSLGKKLEEILGQEDQFIKIIEAIKNNNIDYIIKEISEEKVDVKVFIDWCFRYIVSCSLTFEKKGNCCKALALMEKMINDNVDSKIVFLAYLYELQRNLK